MPTSKTSFIKRFGYLGAAVTGCWASLVLADTTMVYEMSDAEGNKTQHTFTIVERFVRIDSDPTQKSHWLYDSGFRKLYKIDDDKRQYKLVRVFDNPHLVKENPPKPDSKPKLVASKEKKNVAGVRCRVIVEKLGDEVVAQHCMAGTGPLGLTKREVYTLSRLLTAPGKQQFGWVGAATSDERFASLESQAHDSKQGLKLKSISHDSVADERVQIPKTYKNLDAPAKKAPEQKPDTTGRE